MLEHYYKKRGIRLTKPTNVESKSGRYVPEIVFTFDGREIPELTEKRPNVVKRIDTQANHIRITKHITRRTTTDVGKKVVSGEQPGEDEGEQI